MKEDYRWEVQFLLPDDSVQELKTGLNPVKKSKPVEIICEELDWTETKNLITNFEIWKNMVDYKKYLKQKQYEIEDSNE